MLIELREFIGLVVYYAIIIGIFIFYKKANPRFDFKSNYLKSKFDRFLFVICATLAAIIAAILIYGTYAGNLTRPYKGEFWLLSMIEFPLIASSAIFVSIILAALFFMFLYYVKKILYKIYSFVQTGPGR